MQSKNAVRDHMVACLGGTFDRLHPGHEWLLSVAFRVADEVIVGLTGEELLLNKKHKDMIQPYEKREQNVRDHAKRIGREIDLHVVKLTDPLGPVVSAKNINVLVCSMETISNTTKINEARLANGLPPVIIVAVPLLEQPNGTRYSSTELRETESGVAGTKWITRDRVMEIAGEVDEHDEVIKWACALLDALCADIGKLDESVVSAWFVTIDKNIDKAIDEQGIPECHLNRKMEKEIAAKFKTRVLKAMR
jgi:pantetheine-phosphate adenylyltransferase